MTRTPALCLAVILALTAAPASTAERSKDWPQWRGPNRDAKSTETGLMDKWPDGGPKLVWRVDVCGRGYSSVAIADGRIFTLGDRRGRGRVGRRRSGCFLIALSVKDGSELWATPVGQGRPNCTPTGEGGLVYTLDRNGNLACCRATSGQLVWQKNFQRDFGGRMMSGWGYSESPLIDGDALICTPGGRDAMIVALNKKTGRTIWKASVPDLGRRGRDGAGYSSIVVSNGGGVKQYVQLTGRGIVSVRAKDGKFLWSYNRIANGTANIPTPIVKGNFVFCSTGYGSGAALLELSSAGAGGVTAAEKYFLSSRTLQNHHGGMVLIGDYVYCGHAHNQGFPICVELESGDVQWGGRIRGPGGGSAAIVYADKHLYFRYEDGVMALIEASSDRYTLKSSFTLASRNGKSWPHPVILDGKLYVRDQQTLLCYDIRKK